MTTLEKKAQQMKDKYKISDANWASFFEDIGELLAITIETNKPYLAQADREIVKAIKELNGMGQVQANFNIYDYKVDYAVFSYSKKVKFD